MTTDRITCPACGSSDVTNEEQENSLMVPYGPAVQYVQVKNVCRSCGESGDFVLKNDANIVAAKQEAVDASVARMLALLSDAGVSMAYFERALSLPSRTAARWKQGEHSATVVALLRVITTCPWLLDVADHGFDPATVNKAVLMQAGNIIYSTVHSAQLQCHISVARTDRTANLNVQLISNVPSESGTLAPSGATHLNLLTLGN